MQFSIITIFPEAFQSYLNSSMLWKAQDRKKISVRFFNPRDYTKDKHKKVDARPYGGGPGMVLTAQPILDAVNAAKKKLRTTNYKLRTVILSPRGKQFTNKLAQSWAKRYDHLILIAGHYEGIDARVKKILSAKGVGGSAHSYGGKAEEISIGPFVLTGGELPAMVIVDAVSRHVKGVLGRADSLEDERVASKKVFTRPEVLRFKRRKYVVPKVLLGGDHRKIEEWRRKNQ